MVIILVTVGLPVQTLAGELLQPQPFHFLFHCGYGHDAVNPFHKALCDSGGQHLIMCEV
jgi:hypothetical protein